MADSEAADEPAPDCATRRSPADLHDVTVVTRSTYQCARVEGVPPEEFGIARNARMHPGCRLLLPRGAARGARADRSKATTPRKSASCPAIRRWADSEAQARDTVDESTGGEGDDGANRANRLLRITEHYVRMDYDGDGKAALYRVTTGGDEGELLRRDGEADVMREDARSRSPP